MTDYCLDLIGARGEIIIEGRFARNAGYATALAALRGSQTVLLSGDETGTVRGAALLARWPERPPATPLGRPPAVVGFGSIDAIRTRWRAYAGIG